MIIEYKADAKLELRVKDTGALDHFDIFVNGTLRRHITDNELHVFPLERPQGALPIAVHFEGRDGGKSAVIDVTDVNNPSVLGSQRGLIHSYIMKRV